jgi:hypothetical protein
VRTRVRSLTRGPSGAWRLEGPELGAVDVDRVVLTTGHAFPNWTASTRAWRRSPPAARRPPSGCPLRAWGLRGGHGSGRPVGGSVVGVLGLGLSFYDVMAALTIGRGERFEAAGDGLQYEPSGREPLVVAGSRSGVPVPARGRNQKPPDYVYVPLLFTRSRMLRARRRGPLHFSRDVEPSLVAEMDLVHHGTALRRAHGERAVRLFHERVTATIDPADPAPRSPSRPDGSVVRSWPLSSCGRAHTPSPDTGSAHPRSSTGLWPTTSASTGRRRRRATSMGP